MDWPPRVIIAMDVYEDGFKTGANEHYSLDSCLIECCEDFFRQVKINHPKAKIKINKSKLEIRYVDLP